MATTPPSVQSLIPHTGAMCLLDRIEAWDASSITCSATSHTRPDNPLRYGDRLSAQAGVEYAAQAMAAHAALSGAGDERTPRAVLAVVNQLRWHIDRLDSVPAPLAVRAWHVAALPAAQCYGFALTSRGLPILEGEAIVVMAPASSRPPDDATESPSR